MTATSKAGSEAAVASSMQTSATVPGQAVDGVHELTALERLTLSRTRMRAAMIATVHPPSRPSLSTGPRSPGHAATRLLDLARSLPGVTDVLIELAHWRAHLAALPVARVATAATEIFVAPVVRRNPRNALLISAGIGALIVLVRPWRLLLRPKFLLGLLAPAAVFALKRVPTRVWFGLATKAVRRGVGAAKSGPAR